MLYIVGVYHGLQYNGFGSANAKQASAFKDYLNTQCIKLKPSFIAEEFSEDALKKRRATSNITTCKEISGKFNIEHIFIDPSIKEHVDLDIPMPDKNPFEKRENFWLSKIQSKLDNKENGLIIIGSSHIETFPVLLKSKNIPFSIFSPEWNPEVII